MSATTAVDLSVRVGGAEAAQSGDAGVGHISRKASIR